jgi:hypothetical protein
MLLANVQVHYSNTDKVDLTQSNTLLTTISDGPVNVDWGRCNFREFASPGSGKGTREERQFW